MGFRFENLEIWQLARAYATTVYNATAKFPAKEDFGLTSQMNRAVNSISLNIAEGSGKKSNKAFDYHLEISLGSACEVVSAAFLALDRGYIKQEEHGGLSRMRATLQEHQRVSKYVNSTLAL